MNIKLQIKYLFPTSSWGTNVYIYQLPEGLRIKKILAHMVLGCKRIHKPGLIISAFWGIFMKLCMSKVKLTPPHVNFINGVTNPEIIYFEIFVLLDINYNYFLLFNNFLISFKRRNAIAISWNYSTNKKNYKEGE